MLLLERNNCFRLSELLEVEAQIPAIQLPQVRVGAPAQITSDTDLVRLQCAFS